jgi:flagellar motility protein MotE (MotC chaperone)
MKLPQIYGKEIFKEINMKNKFSFVFVATAISFLFGKFLFNEIQNPQEGLAYAQVEPLDKEVEETRSDTKKPILEEKGTEKEAVKDKKVALPTKMPPVKPETFRMFETIEKKNKELKRREEELKIKERKIKAIEAKVSKNLEKIEQRISKSKQQLGIQDEKTKENVQVLVKVYSSMKPGEAARLIEAIDEDLALKIVSGMKSKIAGQVLSQLDVKVAKRISETLAGKVKKKK